MEAVLRKVGLAAVALLAFLPSRSQAARSDIGAISGVVVDGDTSAPISGAVVFLGPVQNSASSYQLTDSKGRFVFLGLTKGKYFVRASRLGFADGAYGVAAGDTVAANIDLLQDQWFRDADIRLEKLSGLSGTVAAPAYGPLPNAVVRVVRRFQLSGHDRWASGPAVLTDGEGRFHFENLRQGDYVVSVIFDKASVPPALLRRVVGDGLGVRDPIACQGAEVLRDSLQPAPHQLHEDFETTFFPDSATLAAATPIRLGAGESREGIDIEVQQRRGYCVEGRVLGASGPVSGAHVRLTRAGNEGLGPGFDVATALTGDSGRFVLAGVPKGNYTLAVGDRLFEFVDGAMDEAGTASVQRSPPGFANIGTGGLVPSAPAIRFRSYPLLAHPSSLGGAHLEVEVDRQDLRDLAVHLTSFGNLSGRLVMDDGSAVPSGSVEFAAADGDPSLGARRVALIPSGKASTVPGTFEVAALAPGRYVVRVVGMSGVTMRAVTADGSDVTRSAIEMDTSDLSVTISLTRQGAGLRGLVQNARSEPVVAAAVLLFPADQDFWANFGFASPLMRRTVTAPDGRYSFGALAAGDYLLVAVPTQAAANWGDPGLLRLLVPFAERVRLEWNKEESRNLVLLNRGQSKR